MKKLIILLLLCFAGFGDVFAQSQASADSVAYQLQRKKINTMLAARKLKFGMYGQSLSQHTGIFGLQTKSDIRRSNEILMDIVKTDDEIYKELKILLAYRAFQQRQIQGYSKEADAINDNYRANIKTLLQQNAKLKADAKHTNNTVQPIYITIIVLMLASILYLLYKRNKVKGVSL